MQNLESFIVGSPVALGFNTRAQSPPAPITFAGTPRLRVLNASNMALVEADIVPSIDVGGVTGRHLAVVDTDDPAYEAGNDYLIAVQAGTVDGVTVVGEILARFSLNPGTLPTNSVTAAAMASDAVIEIQSGLATAAGLASAVDPLPTNAELATAIDPIATTAELAAAQAAIIAAVPTAVATADALLGRNQKGGANGPAGQTVADALAGGLGIFSINTNSGVITIYNGDGTVMGTRNLTRASLNAIVSSLTA